MDPECACFIPGCTKCFNVSFGEGATNQCNCFLADCPWCQIKNFEEREKLAGSGRALSPDAVRVVAEVDRQLAAALEAGQDNYLQLGPAFTSLPTWKSSGGSRRDHLVAFLCGRGPYDVRSARQKISAVAFGEHSIAQFGRGEAGSKAFHGVFQLFTLLGQARGEL